jgi:hypothetical protein
MDDSNWAHNDLFIEEVTSIDCSFDCVDYNPIVQGTKPKEQLVLLVRIVAGNSWESNKKSNPMAILTCFASRLSRAIDGHLHGLHVSSDHDWTRVDDYRDVEALPCSS